MERCAKMIYTSYFGKIKNFPADCEPICIARWRPAWYKGKACLTLAPSVALLKWWKECNQTKADEQRYTEWYIEETLSKQSAAAIYKKIKSLAPGKTPILVCYEKGGFCHRNIVRKWLNENNIRCEEWHE